MGNMGITEFHRASRNEMKQRVVGLAAEAFRVNGVKDVTMDDIARQLGMSKRTLYQLFKDKQQLLLECVRQYTEREERVMGEYMERAGNVVSFFLQIFERRIRESENVSPRFLPEMKKYPEVMKYMREHHRAQVDEGVDFLRRGMAEGLLRSDIDPRIVFDTLGVLADYITSETALRS